MRFSILFTGVVGLSMIVQWGIAYQTGQIIELETEPIRIAFHLAAEFLTASCLMISAGGLLRDKAWSRELGLISLGMLFYTAVVSPGYFAQQGEWIWIGLFGVILVGGAVCAFQITRLGRKGTAFSIRRD